MNQLDIRPSWDSVFMEFVEILAKRSTCVKMQTAAVITHETQIISIGYNGTFSKSPECLNYWLNLYKKINLDISFVEWQETDEFKLLHREWAKSEEIHAEANALGWISKFDDTLNYTMYTLYSPCDACAKEIIKYGIGCIYYKYKYKHGDKALERLMMQGIDCQQF